MTLMRLFDATSCCQPLAVQQSHRSCNSTHATDEQRKVAACSGERVLESREDLEEKYDNTRRELTMRQRIERTRVDGSCMRIRGVVETNWARSVLY